MSAVHDLLTWPGQKLPFWHNSGLFGITKGTETLANQRILTGKDGGA